MNLCSFFLFTKIRNLYKNTTSPLSINEVSPKNYPLIISIISGSRFYSDGSSFHQKLRSTIILAIFTRVNIKRYTPRNFAPANFNPHFD